ncbi:DUF4142 domain-containing protein [Rufibacter tibetensis]|nr:DUF4142 domain-containing protein [Rufibacter tibetensis]
MNEEVTKTGGGDLSDQDKMFLEIAGSAGIMEVELGKMAVEKGTRREVVEYGGMMVKEHTEVNQKFRKLLERLDVEIPEGMNERNTQTVKEHAALSGKEFDERYVQTIVEDHKLATEMFKKALSVAKNENYKEFLSSMIPIVEMHYHMAQRLQK